MQLSKFTDYSVRVLIYLSTLEDDQLTQITEVSERYKISRNHLVKVVYKLGQVGWVETVRGKNGGFRLKVSPEDIKVGDVVRILEPLDLLNCSPKACNISPICELKKYLHYAKEKFLDELNCYTIADLVSARKELTHFLFHQKSISA